MGRVIAVANQKGGCGKTTTTINLGACLARLNRRVLLVDLDPQAHTSVGLGILPEKLDRTLYDLLCPEQEEISWEAIVHRLNPFLSLLPGDLRLSQFEEAYAGHPQREKQLKYLLLLTLPGPNPFDFILIDCPPNLGLLTRNALEAAQEVVIPIEPSFFSLHGLAKISETLQQVAQKRGRSHQIHALLTLFEGQDRFEEEVHEEVRKHFRERVFHTLIHQNVALREAAGAGLSIVDFDPESIGYRDHMSLACELLERGWTSGGPTEGEKKQALTTRLGGPKKVLGGMLFQYQDPEARQVLVAGDFNHWVAEPLVRRNGNGLWQRVVPVQRGSVRYKFLVDGEWRVDPEAPQQKDNPHGGKDSYVEIDAA